MTTDALFAWVEARHADRPVRTVLDAGTGDHSLRWLTTLDTSVTAVTADEGTAARLRTAFPTVQVVTGDWRTPALLAGRTFDLVLADYLLGAVDGFQPHWQDQVLRRLRPHVADRLYLVGLEPWPDKADDPDAQAFIDLCRTRDAAFLLAGIRPYRELPAAWVRGNLEDSGFTVVAEQAFPIRHSSRTVDREHGNVVRTAQRLDRTLGSALVARADALRERLLARCRRDAFLFGADYAIAAAVSSP